MSKLCSHSKLRVLSKCIYLATNKRFFAYPLKSWWQNRKTHKTFTKIGSARAANLGIFFPLINQFLMTTFLILQLWHEEGAVALLRHSSARTSLSTLSDLVSVSLSLSPSLALSLIHSLFHLFAIVPAQFKCICSVSVQVEIIHANQEQWFSVLGSQRGLSLRRSLAPSRSSHYIFPLIAELLYVYSDWKDSIYCNCCLALLTTFFIKELTSICLFKVGSLILLKTCVMPPLSAHYQMSLECFILLLALGTNAADSRCLTLLLLNRIGTIV